MLSSASSPIIASNNATTFLSARQHYPQSHGSSAATPPSTPPSTTQVHQHRPYSFSALALPQPAASAVPITTLPSAPVGLNIPATTALSGTSPQHPHQFQHQQQRHSSNNGGGHHHNHNHHSNQHNNGTTSTVQLPDGRLAMVVVDPLTRKLTIPFEHIVETRAQLRYSIPSLCQLFLQGRCRQGQLCHQVHADPFAVNDLRQLVDRLPLCCVEHGDQDFTTPATPSSAGSNNNASHLIGNADRTCVRVPKLPWNNGLIPLRNLSFTQGLLQVLQHHQQQSPTAASNTTETVVVDLAHGGSSSHVNLCRLHIIDRCRFAEDCKFLHICKHVAQQSTDFINAVTAINVGGHSHYDDVYPHPQQHQHQRQQQHQPQISKPAPLDAMLYQQPTASTPISVFATVPSSSSIQLVDFMPQSITPVSPNEEGGSTASDSTTEPSLVGSFVISPSISPMITKKYRGGSWSYDPYSASGSLMLVAPPHELLMAMA